MARTVIRQTDLFDLFTNRELGQSNVFTLRKSANSALGSDNECFDGCEEARFTSGEYEVIPGACAPPTLSSTAPAGVMSTCDASFPQTTVDCAWCGCALHAGIGHSICPTCSSQLEQEIES